MAHLVTSRREVLMFVHCDEERCWQAEALRRSIEVVGQEGTLVVRSDQHPDRERYVILDRVLAFDRVMRAYKGDDPVAILDPDMVLVRRFAPDVERGWGQASIHALHESQRKNARQLRWIAQDSCSMQHTDLPWVLCAQDARRLAPLWLDATEQMVADKAIRSLFGWTLDMWSFGAVARGLGTTFDVSNPLTCVPGRDRQIGNAWVLHYFDAVNGFSKRTYQPGDVLPEMRWPEKAGGPYDALRRALQAEKSAVTTTAPV